MLENKSGRVILVFCRDNKQVFTMESSDDGVSWGGLGNISASVTEPGWDFIGTGPPGSIQLASGRLIIGVLCLWTLTE